MNAYIVVVAGAFAAAATRAACDEHEPAPLPDARAFDRSAAAAVAASGPARVEWPAPQTTDETPVIDLATGNGQPTSGSARD